MIFYQISNPAKLEEVDLKVVSEKFDPANNTFVDHLWGWMKGSRTTGTQQTEVSLLSLTIVHSTCLNIIISFLTICQASWLNLALQLPL